MSHDKSSTQPDDAASSKWETMAEQATKADAPSEKQSETDR